MRDDIVLRKNLFVGLIAILFLVLLFFLIIDGYLGLDRDLRINSADIKDSIDYRMAFLLYEVNVFPQDIGDDLLFISKLSSLQNMLNSKGGKSYVENDFLEFLMQSTAYYQLRYIDEDGQEVIRTEYNGVEYEIISQDQLLDKSKRYYFKDTMKLNAGEIFLSRLDLNVEGNHIENRGSEKNPVYVPVIRLATPVFNDKDESKGIIILNIYADYFLSDIRNFQRPGEDIFLIDINGEYLANYDRSKEFASLLGKEDNFYKDYSEFPKEIFLDFSNRRYDSDNFIYTFRYISPNAGNSFSYKKSNDILEQIQEENYFWILVSVSERDELNYVLKNIKREYMYFLFFSVIIVFIIFILICVLAFKIKNGVKHGKFLR